MTNPGWQREALADHRLQRKMFSLRKQYGYCVPKLMFVALMWYRQNVLDTKK